MPTEKEITNKLNQDFIDLNFTAIDFETANFDRYSACAIGLAVVNNGEIIETGSFLIRPPEMYFIEKFIRMHGITKSKVRWKHRFPGIWSKIRKYIDYKVLVAHNANFDEQVLINTLAYYGLRTPTCAWIDTLEIARNYFPELPNHKLSTVAKHLNIDLDHHEAESDAIAAARIVIETRKIDPDIKLYNK